MRTLLALLGTATVATAAPTREVGGTPLPILDAEPAFDEGAFVAPAGSPLAQTYRARLVASALEASERAALHLAALPPGLFVVKIHRDRRGRRYLYQPCDAGYHQRTLIGARSVVLLGNEPIAVPITRTTKRGRITTLALDTSGLPPMITDQLRLRSTTTAGIYEIAAGDGAFDELVSTPAAAAKLDVVVRVCKKARVPELDFAK